MENRIQINGDWYIKEQESTTAADEVQPKELDLVYTEMCLYEVLDYCFEATRCFKDYDSSEFYEDAIDIKVTDKRTKSWKIHNWDNVAWFRGVFDGDKRAINDALAVLGTYGVMELTQFIGHLIKIGWIKYYNCENIIITKTKTFETDHRLPGVGC